MDDVLPLRPAVAASLAMWHEMLARRDLADLPSITSPDVIFRSPVAHGAYHSLAALRLALTHVIEVLNDFTYHRQAATADGLNVVLEFSARVGEKDVKGVDFIRFDEDGKIVEFEVMMRPLSGTQALAAEMGRRVADTLPHFKMKS